MFNISVLILELDIMKNWWIHKIIIYGLIY